MSTSISRAAFLKGMAGLAVAGLGGTAVVEMLKRSRSKFPCRMLGPSRELGHLLRNPASLAALQKEPAANPAANPTANSTANPVGGQTETTKRKIVIIGGGVAGLSAAWWLHKHGVHDFVLLELEKEVGGNASCGKNQYGSYPWGAHYIPIPNKETAYLRELLIELNILQGYAKNGEPLYDELMICHEPQERLWKDGAFHEGLVPKRGLQPNESEEMGRFFADIGELRAATGSDGKPAFAIPLDLSTQDEKYRALDKISMGQWLKNNNFTTKPLLWYVNYCCRDDYGSTVENVSAWAGLHYFAGRRGTAGNAEQNAVLTWPQGNGFIVQQLRQRLANFIRVDNMVTGVSNDGGKVITNYATAEGGRGQIESDYAVFAAPRFIARHIIGDKDFQAQPRENLSYAPWLVANISLKHLPGARGAAAAWDNVNYYSQSLGYVMADHQEITTRPKPCVITYYYPLSQAAPKQSRNALYSSTAESWADTIVKDLSLVHPEIESLILSMDIWPWGHGMIRPDVGYIWGEKRKKMKDWAGKIAFAHSDMSGISNFEEAQYHGVEAAKALIERMGRS